MRGARPPLALLALAGFVFAWWQTGTLAGRRGRRRAHRPRRAITVGRLLAGLVPGLYLRLGIITMAIIDAYLVFTEKLQGPNATLNAAVPVQGAPQLQYLDLHYASMGYGDIFVAGVLGGILAAEGTQPAPRRRCSCSGLSILWDLLFLHFNTLPATVPIAVATVRSYGLSRSALAPPRRADRRPHRGPRGRGVMLANYTGGTLAYRELIVFSHTTPKGAVDLPHLRRRRAVPAGRHRHLGPAEGARDVHLRARPLHRPPGRRDAAAREDPPPPGQAAVPAADADHQPRRARRRPARIKAAPALVKLEVPHNSPFAHLRPRTAPTSRSPATTCGSRCRAASTVAEELRDVERLGDVRVRAVVEQPPLVARRGVGGDDHDRDVPRSPGRPSAAPARPSPVHVGQVQVEQDRGRAVPPGELDAEAALHRRDDLDCRRGGRAARCTSARFASVVLDVEDAWRTPPSGGTPRRGRRPFAT